MILILNFIRPLLLLLVFFTFIKFANAQAKKVLEVSYDNTVLIVFDENVESNHVRSCAIGLPESVDFSFKENKILLQALETDFKKTNLIVELINNQIFVYRLVYNNDPEIFYIKETVTTHNSSPLANSSSPALIKSPKLNSAPTYLPKQKADIMEIIKNKNDYIYGLGIIKYNMSLWCGGIWKEKNRYFLKMSIKNNSNVEFEFSGIKLSIQSKKRKKRVVEANNALKQYQRINNLVAKANSKLMFLLEIDPITINKDKNLNIDMWEKSPGERRFLLKMTSDQLLNIKPL